MPSIIVLGAGMVGSAMALDLVTQHTVTIADVNKKSLENTKKKNEKISTIFCDVTNETDLKKTIAPFDLVVCAVPGYLGYQTLKTCIVAKKNVVDISFFPEDALTLHEMAAENNVTAVVDCGVAPGMGNIILGYYNAKYTIKSFECLVGGLPKNKKWPFNYKAPFSPIDVIEEYTRPARYVENGNLVVKEALTDCEYVNFKEVGTLEAFNSDGLRSLIYTMPHIPNMKEKTLRYPHHVEYIKVLKESGFFKTKPLKVNNSSISPLDFTSKILFNEWKLNEHEPEFTIMRITLETEENDGKNKTIVYNLYDEYCSKTNVSSMARTTGYTATAVANLVLFKTFTEKGVFPPELVGKNETCFQFVLKYLKERNVIYNKTMY